MSKLSDLVEQKRREREEKSRLQETAKNIREEEKNQNALYGEINPLFLQKYKTNNQEKKDIFNVTGDENIFSQILKNSVNAISGNFQSGIDRVKESKQISPISEYGVRKIGGEYKQLNFWDRTLSNVTSNLGEFGGYSEAAFSPITTAFQGYTEIPSVFRDDTKPQPLYQKPNAIIKTLSDISEYGGKKYTQAFEALSSTEISQEEKDVARKVGGDLIFSVGGVSAGIATKGLKSGIKSIIKQFDNRNIISEIDKQIIDLRGNNKLFLNEENENKLITELKGLYSGVKAGSVTEKDIKYIKDKFNLKDVSFFTNILEDANKASKVKNRVEGNLFDGYYKKSKPSIIDNTIKKLDELGYSDNLTEKQKTTIFSQLGIEQKTIDEALNIKREFNRADPKVLFSEIHIANQLKKNDFENIADTLDNPYQSNRIYTLEKDGYVKVINDISDDNLYSVQLTNKGKKFIEAQSDIPDAAKIKMINEGFKHIPKEIYDYVKGDNILKADLIKKELEGGVELKRLSELYYDKKLGNISKTLDADIVSNLYKIDERYNLGLGKQIDNIYDSVTGDINITRLDDVIEKVRKYKKEGFLEFKNIKNKYSFRNIKQKLRLDKVVNDEVFKAGKKEAESEYIVKTYKLKQSYDNKIQKLKLNAKKLGDKYIGKLEELNQKRNNELLNLAAKYNNLKDLKILFKEQLINLYKNPNFVGDAQKTAFKKIVSSNAFDKANTVIQLEKAINSIYKELTNEYIRGIQKAIIKELDFDRIGKSSSLAKRKKFTVDDLSNLLTAKELFNSKTGELNIEELEKFYTIVKAEKEQAIKLGKEIIFRNKRALNNKIGVIKKEGIKNLEGVKNLIKDEDKTILKSSKAFINSWFNETSFIPRLMEKVFGKNSLGYNQFVTKTNSLYNRFDTFFNNNTVVVIKNLDKLFGKEIRDFGEFIFTINKTYKDGGVGYSGLKRIMQDELSSFHIKRTTTPKWDKTPEDFPLVEGVDGFMRENIKNTKLGEILENYDNPKYKKGLELWNNYNTLVFNLVKKTSEEVDGIPLNMRDNYMSFKRLGGGDESIDIDFMSKDLTINKVDDGFLNELVENIKGVNYEYNPLRVLATSSRQQIYYAYMRKVFEENKQLLNGTSLKIKDLDVNDLEKYLSNPQYKIYNKDGDIIKIDNFSVNEEGFINSDKGLVKLDELSIKTGKGIIDEFNPETKKYFSEYMETLGKGGHYPDSYTEKLISNIINQANVLPLIGNISVILQQPLTLLDAFGNEGVGGIKGTLNAVKDLHSNPSLFSKLYELDAVKVRGGGDFLVKELNNGLINNNKFSIVYNQYLKYGTAGIKYVDQYIYSQVFYAGYKKYLLEKGLIPKGRIVTDFNNLRALEYAEDMANRISSTANPLWAPSIYRETIVKQLFGIFTTQLNRVQEYSGGFISAIKDRRIADAFNRSTFFFASNATQLAIVKGIGMFLYEIGASKYDEYDKDFLDGLLTYRSLYNITLGQTFLGSKADSIVSGFNISPLLSLSDSIRKDLVKAYKAGEKEEYLDASTNIVRAITRVFGGKLADQIINIANPE